MKAGKRWVVRAGVLFGSAAILFALLGPMKIGIWRGYYINGTDYYFGVFEWLTVVRSLVMDPKTHLVEKEWEFAFNPRGIAWTLSALLAWLALAIRCWPMARLKSSDDGLREWSAYPCQDYCSSELAREGFWDESNQLWLIEPRDRVEEDPTIGFLQVGRPGVGGIGFGYRRHHPGFWACHRSEGGEFQYLGPSIRHFLEDWLAGRVAV